MSIEIPSNINQISQAVALSKVSSLQREDRKKTEKIKTKKFKFVDRTTPTLLKPLENIKGDLLLPFDLNTTEFQPTPKSCLPTCVYNVLKNSIEGTNRKFNLSLKDVIKEMYGKGGITNDRGGDIEEAAMYMRKKGMLSFWKSYAPFEWVKEGLQNGYYIITSINAGPIRHAIIVYGYNKKSNKYYIFDPNPKKGFATLDELELLKLMNDPGLHTYHSIPIRTINLTGPPAIISNGTQGQTMSIIGEDMFIFSPEFVLSNEENNLTSFLSSFVIKK